MANDKHSARNGHSEYSDRSDRKLPDGKVRPMTASERRIAIMRAGIRDEPLPPGVSQSTQVG
jgi:hypothetical protein